MPVVTSDFPCPSRFSFRRMSVSFVRRWMAADRGMITLPVSLDQFQQAFHFFLCADADAHEASANVFRAIAQQDALFQQLRTHFRSSRTEIGQKKIAGARIGLYV